MLPRLGDAGARVPFGRGDRLVVAEISPPFAPPKAQRAPAADGLPIPGANRLLKDVSFPRLLKKVQMEGGARCAE